MNQFRDILIFLLIAFGVGLGWGHPENWGWAARGGAEVVNALTFLAGIRPWSIILCFAIALALFMTRIKY
jgi:hypothetical protein